MAGGCNLFEGSCARQLQTLQVFPSQPIPTALFSMITGTLRSPLDRRNISSRRVGSFLMLRYSTLYPRAAYASRAAVVCGQLSLPKIRTFSLAIAIAPCPRVDVVQCTSRLLGSSSRVPDSNLEHDLRRRLPFQQRMAFSLNPSADVAMFALEWGHYDL